MSKTAPSTVRPKNAALATLVATFPVFRDCLPLAIGIHKSIRERLPDMDQGQLRTALKIHTASTHYLKALSQAETRYDLDGAPAGSVAAEQRRLAAATLRERFRKGAERHKAELAARQHQEKLLQLAAKFNAR